MPPEFRKDDHHLQRLQVAELSGLIFGSFDEDVPDLETYLGPVVAGGIRRVMNRPAHIIGRSTQVLPNNWKLYFENTKDTYHASILHAFLTTFRINRLSQAGGINIDESGGNHFSFAKLDYAAEDAEYKAAQLRSDTDMKLQDNSVIESVDEYGDSEEYGKPENDTPLSKLLHETPPHRFFGRRSQRSRHLDLYRDHGPPTAN